MPNEIDPKYVSDFMATDAETPFGREYQSVESPADVSTTSLTISTVKASITTGVLPLGDYILTAQYKLSVSNANRGSTVELTDGGAVVVFSEESINSASRKSYYQIRTVIKNISGVKTFGLRFKSGTVLLTANNTTTMGDATLSLWRVK
jgi:hypothetical protein